MDGVIDERVIEVGESDGDILKGVDVPLRESLMVLSIVMIF